MLLMRLGFSWFQPHDALCSLSDFQNFRGIKPQRPPATLAKACMQAKSKCSNTTWSLVFIQKKPLPKTDAPSWSPFVCDGVLKKLCISTLTTHLFAVYQFLIFYKLIVNFIYPFKRSFLSILCFGFVTASWTPVLLSSKTSRWRRRPKLHCSPPQSNLELKTFP